MYVISTVGSNVIVLSHYLVCRASFVYFVSSAIAMAPKRSSSTGHSDILLLRRQELRLWAMGQTDSLTTPAAVLLSNPEPKTAVAAVDYRLLYDEPKVEHRPESASEAEENPHLSPRPFAPASVAWAAE